MNNRRRYELEDGPSDKARVIPDFLPPPEELFPKEMTLKVTLRLDRRSVDFFKNSARRHGTKYQRMMREILKRYAIHHLELEQRPAVRTRTSSHRKAA